MALLLLLAQSTSKEVSRTGQSFYNAEKRCRLGLCCHSPTAMEDFSFADGVSSCY
jgi:hypothetical protein